MTRLEERAADRAVNVAAVAVLGRGRLDRVLRLAGRMRQLRHRLLRNEHRAAAAAVAALRQARGRAGRLHSRIRDDVRVRTDARIQRVRMVNRELRVRRFRDPVRFPVGQRVPAHEMRCVRIRKHDAVRCLRKHYLSPVRRLGQLGNRNAHRLSGRKAAERDRMKVAGIRGELTARFLNAAERKAPAEGRGPCVPRGSGQVIELHADRAVRDLAAGEVAAVNVEYAVFTALDAAAAHVEERLRGLLAGRHRPDAVVRAADHAAAHVQRPDRQADAGIGSGDASRGNADIAAAVCRINAGFAVCDFRSAQNDIGKPCSNSRVEAADRAAVQLQSGMEVRDAGRPVLVQIGLESFAGAAALNGARVHLHERRARIGVQIDAGASVLDQMDIFHDEGRIPFQVSDVKHLDVVGRQGSAAFQDDGSGPDHDRSRDHGLILNDQIERISLGSAGNAHSGYFTAQIHGVV